MEAQFSQANGQSYQAQPESPDKLQAAVYNSARVREDGRGGARYPRQGETRYEEEEVREYEDILEAEKVRAIVMRRAQVNFIDIKHNPIREEIK